jgi:hypothetical protein
MYQRRFSAHYAQRAKVVEPLKINRVMSDALIRSGRFTSEEIDRVAVHGDVGDARSSKRAAEALDEALRDRDFVKKHELDGIPAENQTEAERTLVSDLQWNRFASESTEEPGQGRTRVWDLILGRNAPAPVAISARDEGLFIELRRNDVALEGIVNKKLLSDPEVVTFLKRITTISELETTDVFADRKAANILRSLGIPLEDFRIVHGYEELYRIGNNLYVSKPIQNEIAQLLAEPIPDARKIYLFNKGVSEELRRLLRESCDCEVIDASAWSEAELAMAFDKERKHLAVFVGHLEADTFGPGKFSASKMTRLVVDAGSVPLLLGCNSASIPGGAVLGQFRLHPLLERLAHAFDANHVRGFMERIGDEKNPVVMDDLVVDSMRKLARARLVELEDKSGNASYVQKPSEASISVDISYEPKKRATVSFVIREIPSIGELRDDPPASTLASVRSAAASSLSPEMREQMLWLKLGATTKQFTRPRFAPSSSGSSPNGMWLALLLFGGLAVASFAASFGWKWAKRLRGGERR